MRMRTCDVLTTIVSLYSVGSCELNIKHVGQMDTLHLVKTSRDSKPLLPDYIEVHMKCVGLNAKVELPNPTLKCLTDNCSEHLFLFR